MAKKYKHNPEIDELQKYWDDYGATRDLSAAPQQPSRDKTLDVENMGFLEQVGAHTQLAARGFAEGFVSPWQDTARLARYAADSTYKPPDESWVEELLGGKVETGYKKQGFEAFTDPKYAKSGQVSSDLGMTAGSILGFLGPGLVAKGAKVAGAVQKAMPWAMSSLEATGNIGQTMQDMVKQGKSREEVGAGALDYAMVQAPLDLALGKVEYGLARMGKAPIIGAFAEPGKKVLDKLSPMTKSAGRVAGSMATEGYQETTQQRSQEAMADPTKQGYSLDRINPVPQNPEEEHSMVLGALGGGMASVGIEGYRANQRGKLTQDPDSVVRAFRPEEILQNLPAPTETSSPDYVAAYNDLQDLGQGDIDLNADAIRQTAATAYSFLDDKTKNFIADKAMERGESGEFEAIQTETAAKNNAAVQFATIQEVGEMDNVIAQVNQATGGTIASPEELRKLMPTLLGNPNVASIFSEVNQKMSEMIEQEELANSPEGQFALVKEVSKELSADETLGSIGKVALDRILRGTEDAESVVSMLPEGKLKDSLTRSIPVAKNYRERALPKASDIRTVATEKMISNLLEKQALNEQDVARLETISQANPQSQQAKQFTEEAKRTVLSREFQTMTAETEGRMKGLESVIQGASKVFTDYAAKTNMQEDGKYGIKYHMGAHKNMIKSLESYLKAKKKAKSNVLGFYGGMEKTGEKYAKAYIALYEGADLNTIAHEFNHVAFDLMDKTEQIRFLTKVSRALAEDPAFEKTLQEAIGNNGNMKNAKAGMRQLVGLGPVNQDHLGDVVTVVNEAWAELATARDSVVTPELITEQSGITQDFQKWLQENKEGSVNKDVSEFMNKEFKQIESVETSEGFDRLVGQYKTKQVDKLTPELVKDIKDLVDKGEAVVTFQERNVAYLEMSPMKLKSFIRDGGIAMPSIAIRQASQTTVEKFGDIVCIMKKSAIDPSMVYNRVYDVDAYSGRFPEVLENPKNQNRIMSLGEQIDSQGNLIKNMVPYDLNTAVEFMKHRGVRNAEGVLGTNSKKKIFSFSDLRATVARRFKNMDELKADSEKRLGVSDSNVADAYDETKRLFASYEYTFSNIEKDNYSSGQSRKIIRDYIYLARRKMLDISPILTKSSIHDIIEPKSGMTKFKLAEKALSKNGIDPSKTSEYRMTDFVKSMDRFVSHFLSSPTSYFEAKPTRIIDITEVASVVVPNQADHGTYGIFEGDESPEAKALTNMGIPVYEYDTYSSNSKEDIINKAKLEVADATFQEREVDNVTPTQIKEIQALVQKGEAVLTLQEKNVAYLEMSSKKLKAMLDDDGIVMPSIAVRQADSHTLGRFGPIVAIMKKDAVDPEVVYNRTYDTDAYTPRFPKVETAPANPQFNVDKTARFIDRTNLILARLGGVYGELNYVMIANPKNIVMTNNDTTYQKSFGMYLAADYVDKKSDKHLHEVGKQLAQYVTRSKNDLNLSFDMGTYLADVFKLNSKDASEVKLELKQIGSNKMINAYNTISRELYRQNQYTGQNHMHLFAQYIIYSSGIDEIIMQDKQYQKDVINNLLMENVGPTMSVWNKGSKETIPYNLNEALKYMKQKGVRNVESIQQTNTKKDVSSLSLLRASISKMFKSMNELKADSSKRLVTNYDTVANAYEMNEELHEEYSSVLRNLTSQYRYVEGLDNKLARDYVYLAHRYFKDPKFLTVKGNTDKLHKGIKDFSKKDLIEKALAKHGYDINLFPTNKLALTVQTLDNFMSHFITAPTTYFEAKPMRKVGLNEVAALVLPSGDENLGRVRDMGIPVYEYDKSYPVRPGYSKNETIKKVKAQQADTTFKISQEVIDFEQQFPKYNPNPIKVLRRAIDSWNEAHGGSSLSKNSPERIQLRKDIEKQLFDDKIKNIKQDRIAHLVVGLPGSGKSTTTDPLVKQGFLEVDNDLAKEKLPEFIKSKGKLSSYVHKEAGQIRDRIFERTVEGGYNFVLNTVGEDVEGVYSRRDFLKAYGYKVHLHFIDLPIEKAIQRAINRFMFNPDPSKIRFIDTHVIHKYGNGVTETYEAIKNDPEWESVERLSTDVKFGERARVLETIHSSNRPADERRSERLLQDTRALADRRKNITPEGTRTQDVSKILFKPASMLYTVNKTNMEALRKAKWKETKLQNGSIIFERPNPKVTHNRLLTVNDVLSVKKTKPETWKSNITDTFHKFMANWVDDLHYIKALEGITDDVQDKTRKAELQKMFKQIYDSAWLTRGFTSKVKAMLSWDSKVDLKDDRGEVTVKSLTNILKPLDETDLDALDNYLVAKHKLTSSKQFPTAMTAEEARLFVSSASQKIKTAGAELIDLQRMLLRNLVDSQILSESGYQYFVKNHPSYVPMMQDFNQEQMDNMFMKVNNKSFVNIPNPIKVIKGTTSPIISPMESIIKHMYQFTSYAERNKVGLKFINVSNQPEMEGLAIKTDAKEKNTFAVWENGEKVHYAVADDIRVAMENMTGQQADLVMSLLQKPAEIMRKGATITPNFAVMNFLRDQLSAWIMSRNGYIPFYDGIRGVVSAIKKDSAYKDFYRSGAGHADILSLDRNYLKRDLKKIQTGDSFKRMITKNPKTWLEAGWNMLERMGQLLEEGSRIGEFENARKGYTSVTNRLFSTKRSQRTNEQAALAARDVTVDFNRAGIVGRQVNRYIAFFNATVQGSEKLTREAIARPGEIAMRAAIIALFSAMLFADNKDDEEYKEIPQYQKDLFWIMKGTNGWVRIPKPFEFGVLFGTGTERFLRWQMQNDKKAFDGFMGAVVSAFTPNFMLTAVQPVAEVMANYSKFRDRPIVPQSEIDRPPATQYGIGTSEVAKIVGGFLNYSPRKIDHLINSYFATAGRQVRDVADVGIRAVTGSNPPSVKATEVVPVASALHVDPYKSPESINKLFERQKEIRAIKSEVEAKRKPRNSYSSSEYDRINVAVKAINDLSVKIKTIYNHKTMSPDEKRKQIDSIRRKEMEIAKRALR